MKPVLFATLLCLLCCGAFSQAKHPVRKPAAAKPVAQPAVMKNATDSFSYAVGLSIANFYKAQGIKTINNQLVLKALSDAQKGKPLMSETEINSCISTHMQVAQSQKASGAKKAGADFLAQNKTKPGVVTLPSGLQYMILKDSTGPKPSLSDKVKFHYTGSFIDGSVFESSYTNGQPVVFEVGRLIRGWTEALQLMPAGSKWRLFVPSDLGYGDMDNGPIPGGSTLIFDVELLEIVKE